MIASLAGLRRFAGTTFRSLAIRNYRLYFAGQVVSITGNWMQRVAQAWLVLHLTGSGFALGTVTALQFLPLLLAGPWAGVLADRIDKRRVLLATQGCMGVLALTLGLLTLSGSVRLWMVYLLALALGVFTAVDNPARQAFVFEMVGRKYLTNAVGLNSTIFTTARIVGPALAGVLITAVGTGWCFVANGLSVLATLSALLLMDRGQLLRNSPPGRKPGQVREGLRYAWATVELRVTLLLMAVVSALALNFNVILPLLASQTFHGDAGTFGLLFSVLGLGSLAGALFTAGRSYPSRRLLLGSLLVFGALMLAAAAAPTLWTEAALLVPLGVAWIAFQATANSTLQLNAAPDMRGRVMALYGAVFLGTTPIGAPLIGWVCERFGARAGLALGGVAVLLALAALGIWQWRQSRRQLRPRDGEKNKDRAGMTSQVLRG